MEIVGTYPTPGDGISKYIRFLIDALERQAVAVHTTRIFFLRFPWTSLRWLSIRRYRTPNLHVQYTPTGAGPFFLFYCLLKRPHQKLIITSHEMPTTYAKHMSVYLRKLYYAFEKVIHRRADHITVHTSQHREEILELGIHPDKITVLEHPVFEAPGAFSRKRDRNRVVFFGRIAPKKGLETLFEVMCELHSEIKLDIVGPAAHGCEEYLRNLQNKAQDMGLGKRVSFHGYVPDDVVTEILSTASFAVFPYRYITQSGALLTAVGHGLPYIATNLAAFVEFNQRHGGGLLIPVGDSKAMREKIVLLQNPKMLKQLRSELQLTSRDLSWGRFAYNVSELYAFTDVK